MNAMKELSDALAALAQAAARRLYHVPSPLGGRTALGFDGTTLIVPAFQAAADEELRLLGPGGKEVRARVIGFDPLEGIAALRLAEPAPEAAWTAAAALPALGSLALAAAYPSPEGVEARLDMVRFAGDEYIQTDGAPFPGFAGGALISPAGELAGIIAADRPGNEAWVLPAARAAALARAVAERGFPGRAWLGLATIPVESEGGFRLLVTAVEKGGPAEGAGVLVGDLLARAGGSPLERPRDLRIALARARPGEPLELVLERGGKPSTVTATPTEAPPDDQGRRHGDGFPPRGQGYGPRFGRGFGHGGMLGFGHRPGPDARCCEGRGHEGRGDEGPGHDRHDHEGHERGGKHGGKHGGGHHRGKGDRS